MKRSIFLLLTAIIAAIFGCMMLFVPDKAAEGFGLISNPVTTMFFHLLGGMILSAGILNFMVRNDKDSTTLKAILIFNIIFHVLGMGSDILATTSGVIEFSKIIPGYVVHIFVGVGSIIYLVKMKTS